MAHLTHSGRAGREGCRLCYGTTAPSCPPSQSPGMQGDAASHGPNPGVTEQSPVTAWSPPRARGSLVGKGDSRGKVSSGHRTMSTLPAGQGHQGWGQEGLLDMMGTFNCPPGASAAHTELQLLPRTSPLGRLTQHNCRATMELPILHPPPLLSSSSLLCIFFSFPFYRTALGSGGSPKESCLSGPARLLLTNPRNFFPLRKEANPQPTSCLILLRLLCEYNRAVSQKRRKEPSVPSVVSGTVHLQRMIQTNLDM